MMFWKIYFWFILLLVFGSYSLYLINFRIWEFIDIAFSTVSLFGLFCFAWQQKVASLRIWRMFFFVIIAWTITYQFFISSPVEGVKHVQDIHQFLIGTINLLPFLPMLWALYRLGVKQTVTNIG